jgi:membrane protein YdbS with pleckstrin-like domain
VCIAVARRVKAAPLGYLFEVPRTGRGLAPGEKVIVAVKPHWWMLASPVACSAVVIGGGVAAVVVSATAAIRWLMLAALVLSVGWLVKRYVRWTSMSLIVTSARVIERQGVFARRTREIPIGSLADIGYRQSFFERLIGAGDVTLESAGSHSTEVFPDLPHPEEIQTEIYVQLERWRRSWSPSASSIPEQIDRLHQLRQRGVISDSEFELKKAQLLDRL